MPWEIATEEPITPEGTAPTKWQVATEEPIQRAQGGEVKPSGLEGIAGALGSKESFGSISPAFREHSARNWHKLANLVSLTKYLPFMHDPEMADVAAQRIEQISRDVAPAVNETPETLMGKVNSGAVDAVLSVPEYMLGFRMFGKVLGMPAVDVPGVTDQGPQKSAETAITSAAMGKLLSDMEPFSRWIKVPTMASVGGTVAAAEGGDTQDVASSSIVMGALGALTPGRVSTRQAVRGAREEVSGAVQKAREAFPRWQVAKEEPVKETPIPSTRPADVVTETPKIDTTPAPEPVAPEPPPSPTKGATPTGRTAGTETAPAPQEGGVPLKPVQITGKELGQYADVRDLRARVFRHAVNEYSGRTVVNADTGFEVIIPRKGLGKGVSGKRSEQDLLAMLGLPDLIERGRLVAQEADRKGRKDILSVYRFEAPVEIAGQPYTAQITVRQHPDGKRYYYHHVDIEKGPAGTSSGRPREGGPSRPTAGPGSNIPPSPGEGNPMDRGSGGSSQPPVKVSKRWQINDRVTRYNLDNGLFVDREGREYTVYRPGAGKGGTAGEVGHARLLKDALEIARQKGGAEEQAKPTGGAGGAAGMFTPGKPSGQKADAQAGDKYVGLVEETQPRRGEQTPRRKKPLRREDVLIPLLKTLGVKLSYRMGRSGALGLYMSRAEWVKIKHRGDLEVTAHELAHLIDDRIFSGFSGRKGVGGGPNMRPWKVGKNARTYAKELKGISYDTKKVYEGFAEFVRLWATQTERARIAAPEFFSWWENFVDTHHYGPALREAQRTMTEWYDQAALDRLASKIGGRADINEALVDQTSEFRQWALDDLQGILDMERTLTGEQAPAGAYETARLTRGAHSIVEGALTLGAPKALPDGSHTFVGRSLQDILDPLGKRLDNWTLYAVARSARELKEQGRENLFTDSEIDAGMRLETPEFARAFDDYQAWNSAILDFAEAKGLIGKAQRATWQRSQYIPFYRVSQKGQTKRAKGIEGNFAGIRRLSGGSANVRDVLGNMIQNASMLITEALKNEARMKVVQLAGTTRGGGRFIVPVPKEARQTMIDKGQVQDAVLRAFGIDPRAYRAQREIGGGIPEVENFLATMDTNMPEFVKFYLMGQAPRGDNLIAVLDRGKPHFFEVVDPLLYRSVVALNRQAQHPLVRFLGAFRRLGQASVTLTADFMAANIARDTVMGSIMSKHGFKPFLDSARGMVSRIRKDQNYRDFIANGGGFSSYLVDEGAFRAHLEKYYTRKGINYRSVIDTPKKALLMLETLADAFEMSTRLGEHRLALARGAHPRHAAFEAREVSTDFAMRGDSRALGALYDTVMFLKAAANGTDRVYRGFATDSNRAQIAAKTAMLAMASMALYAWNRGNPLYEDLEDWKRDTHWHFFIPTQAYYDFVLEHGREPQTTAEAEGLYRHFMYPKIWEIGGIASIAERTMQRTLDGAPTELATDTLRITRDLFMVDVIPQAVRPLYELAVNKNTFTERDIVPQGLQDLQPWAKATPYTSETLTQLGMATRNLPRGMQVPPAQAEALLRGYFNTWALYGLTLSDAVAFDNRPRLRTDQYPVIRRFYSATPARHTRYEKEFYDMLEAATEARRTMRAMDRQYRPDIADQLEQSPAVAEYNQLNRQNQQVQAINREIRQVRVDPSISKTGKMERIDELTRERNALMKATVQDVEAQRAQRR